MSARACGPLYICMNRKNIQYNKKKTNEKVQTCRCNGNSSNWNRKHFRSGKNHHNKEDVFFFIVFICSLLPRIYVHVLYYMLMLPHIYLTRRYIHIYILTIPLPSYYLTFAMIFSLSLLACAFMMMMIMMMLLILGFIGMNIIQLHYYIFCTIQSLSAYI